MILRLAPLLIALTLPAHADRGSWTEFVYSLEPGEPFSLGERTVILGNPLGQGGAGMTFRVVRANPPFPPGPKAVKFAMSEKEDLRKDARALRTLEQHGEPAPRVVEISENGRILVMDEIQGPTIRSLSRDFPKYTLDEHFTMLQAYRQRLRDLAAKDIVVTDLDGSNLIYERASGRVVVIDPNEVLVGTGQGAQHEALVRTNYRGSFRTSAFQEAVERLVPDPNAREIPPKARAILARIAETDEATWLRMLIKGRPERGIPAAVLAGMADAPMPWVDMSDSRRAYIRKVFGITDASADELTRFFATKPGPYKTVLLARSLPEKFDPKNYPFFAELAARELTTDKQFQELFRHLDDSTAARLQAIRCAKPVAP